MKEQLVPKKIRKENMDNESVYGEWRNKALREGIVCQVRICGGREPIGGRVPNPQ